VGQIKKKDAGQSDGERPPEFMDLVVTEVREQRRENGGLHDVLVRMRSVAMQARFRVAAF
jgi:hypothetical protein